MGEKGRGTIITFVQREELWKIIQVLFTTGESVDGDSRRRRMRGF